jgi:hypothetical protein
MGEQNQELEELKEFIMAECHKAYWKSMNQSMNECLNSGDVDKETVEPHPEPLTEESIEEWGQKNFPSKATEGIRISRWSDFKQKAQNEWHHAYSEISFDLGWLERQANPPPPRKPDVEITSASIPEELVELFAEDAWETDSGAVDWEKTFDAYMGFDIEGSVQIMEFWTPEVTYIIREENDFKGPLDYGSKTLRKLQRLVREARC